VELILPRLFALMLIIFYHKTITPQNNKTFKNGAAMFFQQHLVLWATIGIMLVVLYLKTRRLVEDITKINGRYK